MRRQDSKEKAKVERQEMIVAIEAVRHDDGTWLIELIDHQDSWETLEPMSTDDAIARISKEMKDGRK
jgi:hypothetical protein